MRLDDINAYLDVKHANDCMARRLRACYDEDVQFSNMTDFREAAVLTDSSIRREPCYYNNSHIFKFDYRGVTFWYMSSDQNEVA